MRVLTARERDRKGDNMHIICEVLVIGVFVVGVLFGHWIAKHGGVITVSKETSDKPSDKNSMERQWAEMMRYDGNVGKGEKWRE